MVESRRAKLTKRSIRRDIKRIPTPTEAVVVLDELRAEAEHKAYTLTTDKVPGMVIGGTKTTYTYQDLVRMFPIATFTPEETIPLTFQGVTVQAIAGYEMHVPECFKKIYENHRREARWAASNSAKEAGMQDLGTMPEGAMSESLQLVK